MIKKAKKIKMPVKISILLCLLIAVGFILSNGSTANIANAEMNVYDTYTQGPNSYMVKTQSIYDPTSLHSLDIKNADDMFLYDNILYVADTDNHVVKLVDKNTGQLLNVYGQKTEVDSEGNTILSSDGTFKTPTGVYVRDDRLYVADKDAKQVVILNKDTGVVLDKITKPTSPLFGSKTPFAPLKIAVDSAYNMYITGEGSTNGLMHISKDGEFEGFLGANKTATSLKTFFQSIFFSKEQKERLLKNVPASPTSVAIDNRGLVYTITTGNSEGAVKQLDTSGSEIFHTITYFAQIVSAQLDSTHHIYTVDKNGFINIFDSNGYLIFMFGGKDNYDRFGMLKNPTSIVVDEELNLYVLDKDIKGIVKYSPTEFFLKSHEAVTLYEEGLYLEAEPLWEDIIKYNSSFIYAYRSLARANMKRGNYSLALEQFKLTESTGGYSDAFWEVRNDWLQDNIGWVFLTIALIVAFGVAYSQVKKRTTLLVPVTSFFTKVKSNKIISQLLYCKYFMFHPIRAIEQMRYKQKLTPLPATIMYLLYVLISVCGIFLMGFIWTGNIYNVNVLSMVLWAIVPVLLAVLCNYLVSSVTSGTGKLSHVYIATIYSLTPYILLQPIFILLTNFLTMNEYIILQAIYLAIRVFCIILLFISIFQVHYYGFKGTVKNILLTAFCFIMVILFVLMIYILFFQQFDFWQTVWWEVFR